MTTKTRLHATRLLLVLLSLLPSAAWGTSDTLRLPLRYPLHLPPLLSGNFGELRATHFHAGLDFKTNGQEGYPVICVRDGYLLRVAVSPTGYGNALYVAHPDGIVTLYGHLSRFTPDVQRLVRCLQYRRQSFAVDTTLAPGAVLLHAGDTIAWSGNSGSSGGPHLHFEIRRPASRHILNPEQYLLVPDTLAPRPRALYLYAYAPGGVRASVRQLSLRRLPSPSRPCPDTTHLPASTLAPDTVRYTAGTVTLPAGQVGIGIHADDRQPGSPNKLGIHDLAIYADTLLLFHWRVDSIHYNHGRFINTVKDYAPYASSSATVYTSFGRYRQPLAPVLTSSPGYIRLPLDSLLPLRLELRDYSGNLAIVHATLRGAQPLDTLPGRVLHPSRSHLLSAGPYTLYIKENTLLEPVILASRLDTLPLPLPHPAVLPSPSASPADTLPLFPVFTLAEQPIPLLGTARLTLRGTFPDRSLLCRLNPDTTLTALSTTRSASSLTATVSLLGRYTVARDTLPPAITYLGLADGHLARFRVDDNLSGIATIRVTVRDAWCLYRHDPKSRLLEVDLREPLFHPGPNPVLLRVTDRAGNTATLRLTLTP